MSDPCCQTRSELFRLPSTYLDPKVRLFSFVRAIRSSDVNAIGALLANLPPHLTSWEHFSVYGSVV
jgi:hypothetical protein